MNEFLPLAIFFIGLLAGFLDSTVGAGGSVSIPSLVLVGLSPQLAIVTDRIGSIGQSSAATLKFWKSNKIRRDFLLLFIILGLVGTFVGTHILLSVNPKILQRLLGVVLLILVPLSFTKKDFGVRRVVTNKIKGVIGSVILFGLYVLNGFVGIGAGGMSYYNSAYFFGFTFLEANATSVIPWFLLSVLSVVLYAHAGVINVKDGLSMLVGMGIGGYIGAHIALKKGEEWIKRLLSVVIVLACIKLLIF